MVVATTIYETENGGGDNITPSEDVSRTNSDFGGGGGGGVGVRDPGSRVQFPAGGVAFFATGPGWVLKCVC